MSWVATGGLEFDLQFNSWTSKPTDAPLTNVLGLKPKVGLGAAKLLAFELVCAAKPLYILGICSRNASFTL